MAVRTTDVLVRDVIPTQEGHDLKTYINIASRLVDRVNTKATEHGITVTSDELKDIETYVAAHFYAIKYPKYIEKKVGKSEGTRMGKTGKGLESTLWGQTAITLDPTGLLASSQEKNVGLFKWLGKTRE